MVNCDNLGGYLSEPLSIIGLIPIQNLKQSSKNKIYFSDMLGQEIGYKINQAIETTKKTPIKFMIEKLSKEPTEEELIRRYTTLPLPLKSPKDFEPQTHKEPEIEEKRIYGPDGRLLEIDVDIDRYTGEIINNLRYTKIKEEKNKR